MNVETAFHTSQVSGLINFLNSPSPPPVESRVSAEKAFTGLSVFIRVQWQRWGEYGEVKCLWVQLDTCVTASRCYVFACFSCETVHQPLCISLLTHQLSALCVGSIRTVLTCCDF